MLCDRPEKKKSYSRNKIHSESFVSCLSTLWNTASLWLGPLRFDLINEIISASRAAPSQKCLQQQKKNQLTGSIPSPASRRPSTAAVKVSLSEAPNPSLLSHAIWITPKLRRISLSPSVIWWSLKQTNNTEDCWCCLFFFLFPWESGSEDRPNLSS